MSLFDEYSTRRSAGGEFFWRRAAQFIWPVEQTLFTPGLNEADNCGLLVSLSLSLLNHFAKKRMLTDTHSIRRMDASTKD